MIIFRIITFVIASILLIKATYDENFDTLYLALFMYLICIGLSKI
jgi:hypothetical protein